MAVTGISGIPTVATAGIPLTLNGTVEPNNATNQNISWILVSAGGTGAYITNGNILNTVAAGTVTGVATIYNGLAKDVPYAQGFAITVNANFVAVTNISGIPTTATAGIPLVLNGTIVPGNATNQAITWSVQNAGTTGATITNGNTLNTTAAGAVVVTATVANGLAVDTPYTQNFAISVAVNTGFVAVTNISGIPTVATAATPLVLNGIITPGNATDQVITWGVQSAGTTGATISGGNTLNTSAAGTVTVTATVANGLAVGTPYTQNFTISVSAGFVAVTNISGIPTTATAGIPLVLNGTIVPGNATNQAITWGVQNAGTTGASIAGNTLNTTAAGTVTVTATVANGLAGGTPYTQNFTITVSAGFVAVTNISGIPTTATAGIPLVLNGTIVPGNATNQAITWGVQNAGTTGASFTGNTLNTTAAGTVIVTATVANGLAGGTPYTQNFTITVSAGFVAVTNISGIPTVATAGTPLILDGLIAPSNATDRTIIWGVQNPGTTGATIIGNTLNTNAAGTVTIVAMVTNGSAVNIPYTKTFTITVNSGFVAVTNITGVSTTAKVAVPLVLSGTITPNNATAADQTITWDVFSAGTTGAAITGNTLNTSAVGTVRIVAMVSGGSALNIPYVQYIDINVGVVAVTGISAVPNAAVAGEPLTLTGTVAPENATYKNIAWSVYSAGTTGANITGNTLNTTGPGTVTVRATITDGTAVGTAYTQNFNISVFQPVNDIINLPTTANAGTNLTLSGTVDPSNATNRTIAWSVQNAGTTGAAISGSTLSTTNAGTVTVRAAITNGLTTSSNYTKDFNITVNTVQVTNITGIPVSATAKTAVTLNGTIAPTNATKKTISWSVSNAGTTGATISGNTLNTTNGGTVTVTATIVDGLDYGVNYTQDFNITVVLPVTDITGLPSFVVPGTSLQLIGTVIPENATYQTITWSLKSAGTTNATINDNSLYTTAPGSITIIATIANGQALGTNFTKEFSITVQYAGIFTITLAQITDHAPFITGPTISRTGVGSPQTTTLSLENPEQYSSIEWYITGTSESGTGASFTLDATNSAYNLVGQHFLTLEVVKGGVPYNSTVVFTVAR